MSPTTIPHSDTVHQTLSTRASRASASAPGEQCCPQHAGRIIAIAAIAFLSACGGSDLSAQLSGEAFDRETDVFRKIESLDYAAIARAYDRLAERTYQLETETRQMDAGGRTVASEARTLYITSDGGSVKHLSTHGEIEEGFMRFATSGDSIPDQGRDVMELWMPEDPAFASPRNREYYRYAQQPDTVAAGGPCYVFLVRALDGVPAEKMPVRSARMAVAQSDSSIVWLRVERQDDALFYGESSVLEMRMIRTESGILLPALRSVSVTVDAPLRSTKRFASTQRYRIDAGTG